MTGSHSVQVRRIYETPLPTDGTRILVDRLWPRGLTKEKARIEHWCKDIAPTPQLRKWYGHDPELFEEFSRRYRTELEAPEASAALARLRNLADHGPMTLLTATKEPSISEAAVLCTLIKKGPQP